MSANVPGQSVKQPGSAFTSTSGSEFKKQSQEKVVIPEDAWLDILKHLSCQKWSKMRLVTRQLYDMVQRNVSLLPLAIIESAEIRFRGTYFARHQKETEGKMIVFDSPILPDEQDQWFKDRGITNDLPGDIQLNNALIGLDLKKNWCIDLCILGPDQGEELTADEQSQPWFFDQQFKTKVLFYAEFCQHRNPSFRTSMSFVKNKISKSIQSCTTWRAGQILQSQHRNKYSWTSLAFFLELLYDRSTFVKKLSMYGIHKKLNEILFPIEEERYIRCGSFTIQVTSGASIEELWESVSWMEQNVHADNIQFSRRICHQNNDICDAMTNYLLGTSWKSVSQVVKLGEIYDAERFFGILFKKFPSVAVQTIFPTIVASGYRPFCCDSLNNQPSGKSIVKEKLDDSVDDSDDFESVETYTISNGSNTMQIKYIRLILYVSP